MAIATVTETAILAMIFNATPWANYAATVSGATITAAETNILVSLNSADPLTGGNMSTSEIVYTGYARVAVARTTAGWTAPTGGGPASVSPVANINFPAGTGGGPGPATNFTTGHSGTAAQPILWSGTVSPSITVGNGITPSLTTATTITLA
jgi:hypothetical protein